MKQLVNLNLDIKQSGMFQSEDSLILFAKQNGLDGLEGNLYALSTNTEKVKPHTVGLHLPFHPYFHLLLGSKKDLLDYCENWRTVEQLFGVTSYEDLVAVYSQYFNLAEQLDVEYVVFHPVICDRKGIYTQRFPWSLQYSLDLCASLLNQALAASSFSKKLLFENLWWKKSFTLESRHEYDYLRSRVDYDNCGICLDTGHMMATNPNLSSQHSAIDWLEKRIHHLDISDEIYTMHLNASLGGAYLEQVSQTRKVVKDSEFWHQFGHDLKHISVVDPHLPFYTPQAHRLLDIVRPNNLVHELRQDSFEQWQRYLNIQQDAISTTIMQAAS